VSPPVGSSPAVNRPLIVVALMLSMAMAAMEMTIVSTAMPTIVGELGGLPLYAWVAAVYLLTSTVTVPLYGKLADLFGRKPVLLAGIAMFLLGSVACALARSMPGLIAARALQGLGAGAMQPIALTIIGDLFTVRERGRIQPWFGAVWGVAGLAGPMVGGVLVKHLSWPWVFWINLPVGLAAMGVLSVALVERVERRRVRLDVAGAVLLSGAVVALLLAVEGVATAPLIALSLGLFVALVLVERRAAEPLVPLDLFTSRVLGLSNGLSALQGGIMIAVATYVPLFVQAIVRGTPTEAGSAIAPMLVAWPIAAFVAGRVLPRTGYRPLIVVGFLLIGVSSLGLPWLARPDSSLAALQLLTAVMGAGMGLASTAIIIVVQSAVPWERRGVATASSMFSRTIGGTLAVGVLGAVLARVVGAEAAVPPEVMQDLLVHGAGGATASAESARLSAALGHGITVVFDAIAVLGVVGAVVALFFPALRVEPAATAQAHVAEV
jgi:EmrB/QacA subfamily drug resistance transporter